MFKKFSLNFFTAFDQIIALFFAHWIFFYQLILPIYVSFLKKRTLIDFIVACASIANKIKERQ